ncbi:MAG TPA: hypothetical protein VNY25_06835 [Steroidobacteraceae bacterium]|nr:hypothetical protein [Steroidobacteraceae bacterium]
MARSEPAGPEAAVRGGPVSLEEPLSLFPLVAQPAQHSSAATKAALIGERHSAIERVLMRSVNARFIGMLRLSRTPALRGPVRE